MDINIPESESQKERKLRMSKTYSANVFDRLVDLPASFLKVGEVLELSTVAKGQVRNGLAGIKPGFNIHEVKSISKATPKEKPIRHTSAYCRTSVEGKWADTIADSGAGISVMSKNFLNRLGWPMDEPTNVIYTMANGSNATALGVITKVPICFEGKITYTINCIIVTNSET